jgi:ribose transport system permease protein
VAVAEPSEDLAPTPPAARGLAGHWDLVLRLGLLGIVIVLVVFFAIRTWSGTWPPIFLTTENVQNIGRQMAVIGVLAVGETFVIITAGIDLSVGSVLGVSGVVAALELLNGFPLIVAILSGVILATFIGLFNGLLIDTQRLPPFIVTLGMLGILRGVTQILGSGKEVTFDPTKDNASGYLAFATNTFLGVPNLFWVLVAVCVVAGIFLHFTRRGQYIYALGSNLEGARRAGVNIRATTLTVYAISGFLAGVAGIMLTARTSLGDPLAGTGDELNAIAASVLGGASLFGARGSIVGTFLGVLLVSEIANGIDLINADPFLQQVIQGSLLIAVVWVDQWRKRRLAQ